LFFNEEKELTRQEYVRMVRAKEKMENHRLSLVIQTICAADLTIDSQELSPGMYTCGVSWTVNGKDIPENATLTDLDMGVTMNTPAPSRRI
jgi:hypothetical protein